MSRITLDSIAQELKQDGWKVTSEEYVNLDTEMAFECNEGHPVHSTWKKIRQKRVCPVCELNHLKNLKTKITPKNTHKERTLALDQATHISGWSVYDGTELTKYGTFETTTQDEASRIHEVNMWLVSMVQNWNPDLIAIEGIQLEPHMGVTTFQTLARLQGVLIENCVQLKVPFKICHTNTWRAHCGVKGKTRTDKKRSIQMLVKQWFDITVSEDCADAIGIGKFAAETRSAQTEIMNWE